MKDYCVASFKDKFFFFLVLEVVESNINKYHFFRLIDCSPPDYVLPGYKERPLIPLLPVMKNSVSALKDLAISPFNPPPGHRKLKVCLQKLLRSHLIVKR